MKFVMASVGKVGSPRRYKITVMGDQYVGKTSIIRRYVRNEFSPTYINTAAGDYFKKQVNIDGVDSILQIFDIAGQADRNSIIEIIYRHSDGILLVFDFSRQSTLQNIPEWLKLLKMKCDKQPELVLLGNKIDLSEDMRKIKVGEAAEVGIQHKIHFLKGSAKKNINIDTAFKILAKRIHDVKAVDDIPNGIADLRSTSTPSTCCH